MRSRDLIDGFDYGEYMQRQMFCFGSDDDGGDDSGGSYSGGLDFSGEEGDDFSSGSYGGYGGDGYGEDPGFDGGGGGSAQTETVSLGGAIGGDSYTPQFGPDVANAMAQAEQNRLAQQVAQSYIDYAPIMGPSLYSAGNVGGSLLNLLKTGSTGGVPIRSNYFADPTTLGAFKDIALGQIPGRMAQAKAGYGLPGIAGGLLGGVGSFTLNQMQKNLEAGGRPVFDATGQLKGVFSEGPFGFGEVYTGTPVEGVEGTGYDAGGRDGGGQETVKPVNPVTGQCDAGYIFDEQLNACRLDTRGGAGAGGGVGSVVPPTPGGYARMGLLDVAPTGLPQFQQQYGAGFGTPQDFAAANLNFRRQGATYPEYFQRPPQLSGYTLLS